MVAGCCGCGVPSGAKLESGVATGAGAATLAAVPGRISMVFS